MKKTAGLLGATLFVLLTGPAALATHQPNHPEPQAYVRSQGQAPYLNPHCATGYPPGQVQGQAKKINPAGKKASFQFERDSGITVGVLLVAGLGAVTLFLATSAVLRRRLIS